VLDHSEEDWLVRHSDSSNWDDAFHTCFWGVNGYRIQVFMRVCVECVVNQMRKRGITRRRVIFSLVVAWKYAECGFWRCGVLVHVLSDHRALSVEERRRTDAGFGLW
jgi:hypothetical protein